MMKGVAVKLPDTMLEEVDRIAADEFDGNRNRAVEAVIERGLAYEDVVEERDRLAEWIEDWTTASRFTRAKWMLFGRAYEPAED